MFSMVALVDFKTLLSLASEDTNTFRSSIYIRKDTLALIGVDNLYPSVASSDQAIGFKHTVTRRGQSESPCSKPLLNRIQREVSGPRLVVVTILVFQLATKHLMTTKPGRKAVNFHDLKQPAVIHQDIRLLYVYPSHAWVSFSSVTI